MIYKIMGWGLLAGFIAYKINLEKLKKQEYKEKYKNKELKDHGVGTFGALNYTYDNKYTLTGNQKYYDKVIILPGSNLLSKGKCVHWGRVRRAIEEGFVIKPHPITQKIWVAKMKKDFGDENVLDPKEGGFELLANCTHCATMPNSEMGMMALMLDKQLSMVSHTKEDREKALLTYESIYFAIANTNAKESLMKLFSARNSGIIFNFDEDAETRMEMFLNNFWGMKVING